MSIFEGYEFVDFLWNGSKLNPNIAELAKHFEYPVSKTNSGWRQVLNYIKFCPNLFLELLQHKFITFLLHNNIWDSQVLDSLLVVICKRLHQLKISPSIFITEDDLLECCATKSAVLIAYFLINKNYDFNFENCEYHPIQAMLKRNDPYFLEEAIQVLYKLFPNEKQTGLKILQYATDHRLLNIINNFRMFIDIFQIQTYDIAKFVVQNNSICSISNFFKEFQDMCLNSEIINYLKIPDYFKITETDYFPTKPPDLTKLHELVKRNFTSREPVDYEKSFHYSEAMLINLPFWFLTDDNDPLLNQVSLLHAPVGMGEAQGNGVFKDFFNKYFLHLEKFGYFRQDGEFTIPAPMSSQEDKDGRLVRLTISYGLGLMILKALISNSGSNNLSINLSQKLHIWFYRALVQRFDYEKMMKSIENNEIEREKLIQEALTLDTKVTKELLNDNTYPDKCKAILEFLLFVNSCDEFLNAVHDGFNLVYRNDILLPSMIDKIKQLREKLIPFYEKFAAVDSYSVMMLLSHVETIELADILNMFEFKHMKFFQLGTNDQFNRDDTTLTEDEKKICSHTQKVITDTIVKWYEEMKKGINNNLKRFMSFCTGNHFISAISKNNVVFHIVLKTHNRYGQEIPLKNYFRAWLCENQCAFSCFESIEEFEDIFHQRIANFEEGEAMFD